MKSIIAAVTINGGPDCIIDTGRAYDPKKHTLDKPEKARLLAIGALVEVDDGESDADAIARQKADAKQAAAEAKQAAADAAETERRSRLTPEELAVDPAANAAA